MRNSWTRTLFEHKLLIHGECRMQSSSVPTSVIRRLDELENINCAGNPARDHIIITKKTCKVCGDAKISRYKIYGASAAVCNACRVFFSRAPYTRRDCRSCRYQKCISAGMSHGQETSSNVNNRCD